MVVSRGPATGVNRGLRGQAVCGTAGVVVGVVVVFGGGGGDGCCRRQAVQLHAFRCACRPTPEGARVGGGSSSCRNLEPDVKSLTSWL